MLMLKAPTAFRPARAINNVGVVYDQGMSVEKKEAMVAEAQGQCAYISNMIDYLFERLDTLKVGIQ